MSAYPTHPPLECDLVMKGGITSGVIYPRAVCELAKTYRLRSVGGASAGAIAAAAAAAAELGRESGGFTELEQMPDDITAPSPAGGSVLLRLFQPTRMASPLFGVLTAAMKKGMSRAVGIVGAVLRGFWWSLLVGALPGIVLAVLAGQSGGWAGVVAAVVLAILGGVFGLALSAVGLAGRLTGWGMCTGMPGVGAKGAPALTPWLHERIQTMAGRAPTDAPVTFGDLNEAGITLRTMTTNVTRHQPMSMPWAAREYYLDPAVMADYFPADVVDWLTGPVPASPATSRRDRWGAVLDACARDRGLVRMPPPERVPILFATRLSLSFPVLIAAVPLLAVDFSREVNTSFRSQAEEWLTANPDSDPAEALTAVRSRPEFATNWFSDGGLCANLPVHFFDSPLPTRPTFAINLGQLPDGAQADPDPAKNVYLPTNNIGGGYRTWRTLSPIGLGGLFGFLNALVETARSWVDEAQLVLPGYRDRVVLIRHTKDEGGMNLAMPPEVVSALADRGHAAAGRLVDVFAGPQPGQVPTHGFDNHRWIRLRTAGAGLEQWLGSWQHGYTAPAPGGTPYPDLAGAGAAGELPSYVPTDAQRARLNTATDDVLGLAQTWPAGAMSTGAPRPTPRLRLVPEEGVAALDGSAASAGVPSTAASISDRADALIPTSTDLPFDE
ncbi:patatin-like phospholipase family protein [Ruania zhangjianzhongii]|uniref:patatin-like phospholipase family protein n=1 Tax=Ruania zhangjianzhongii TaxID=2603206 RepID=UPI0011CB6B7E|nr:patatin-like phospholipase family protein [Ruania zhangjianzhongii]